MTLPKEYIDASSSTTSRLPTEPSSAGQCAFDTSAARATAKDYRYQHALTLSDLVVSACDEIDRLRAENFELSYKLDGVSDACDACDSFETGGVCVLDFSETVRRVLDGESELEIKELK